MSALLIDADITLFRAAAACEREVRYDDHNHVLYSNADEVWDAVEHQLRYYREHLGDGPMHFALTGSNNFRRTLWPDYKGGRSRKPLCYGYVREKMIGDLDARFVDTLEADDLLGIWATGGKIKDATIVSLDKDLKTIPGKVWRPPANKDQEPELFTISESEADYYWMMQTLTGDVTDGYKGLPGCGPKVAEKLLGPYPCAELVGQSSQADPWWPFTLDVYWKHVVTAYQAKGLCMEDALLQARLARILRASDWDSKNKEVILWEPK